MVEPGLKSKYWDKRYSRFAGAPAPLRKGCVREGRRGAQMPPQLSCKGERCLRIWNTVIHVQEEELRLEGLTLPKIKSFKIFLLDWESKP